MIIRVKVCDQTRGEVASCSSLRLVSSRLVASMWVAEAGRDRVREEKSIDDSFLIRLNVEPSHSRQGFVWLWLLQLMACAHVAGGSTSGSSTLTGSSVFIGRWWGHVVCASLHGAGRETAYWCRLVVPRTAYNLPT